jgi:hypothetical protein
MRETCAWVSLNMYRHHEMKKKHGAKSRLGKKITPILLVMATFKTFGQFNIFCLSAQYRKRFFFWYLPDFEGSPQVGRPRGGA